MNALRFVGRLLILVPLAAAIACSNAAKPTDWTLWYIPNEPKPGAISAHPCHTYVFASTPDQSRFAVAVFKSWNGPNGPTGNTAISRTGEQFSGPLDLGQHVIHDDSTGYDMNVEVVYLVGPYLSAKVRADADCPSARRA